jgi:hypothetical protein
MYFHDDQFELQELYRQKLEGKLKPFKELKRDDLKHIIDVELASVKKLAELFDVSEGKIQDFKRIKRLRDSDLREEKLIQYEAFKYEGIMNEAIREYKEVLTELDEISEEIKDKMFLKMSSKLAEKIQKNYEYSNNIIRENFYFSEEEELV